MHETTFPSVEFEDLRQLCYALYSKSVRPKRLHRVLYADLMDNIEPIWKHGILLLTPQFGKALEFYTFSFLIWPISNNSTNYVISDHSVDCLMCILEMPFLLFSL